MQIHDPSQLNDLSKGTTLYLINPLSCGANIQREVEIKEIYLDRIDKERIYSVDRVKSNLINFEIEINFISDLLSHCKTVFTNLIQAELELREVHKGKYKEEVRQHHNCCAAMTLYFPNNREYQLDY